MATSNNIIDSALDSAEELIAERIQIDQEAKEVEEVEPAAVEKPEAQAEPEESAAPAPEPVADSKSAATPEVAVEQAIEPPSFWSADRKAIFAKAPKEVQQAVAEYEAKRTEWANSVARDSERGKAVEKRAQEVFAPYAEKLKQNDLDPFEAAKQLLAWDDAFEKDPLGSIVQLMQENGITPQDLMNGYQQQPQYPQDPRIEQALAEAREAKQFAQQQRELIAQQQQKQFMSEVERFKSEKDSAGNVRKSFAEMYAPQISMRAEAIQKETGAPLYSSLTQAYEEVLSQARKAFGVSATQTQSTEQVVAQAKKAQAAASSVVGAPANGAIAKRPKAKTIDEALDRAEERLGLRN